MSTIELMKMRHSVRQYHEKEIEARAAAILQNEIKLCNAEAGLNIQLVLNEPKAFNSFMAHYGKFSGVTNYIALIGKKGPELDEKCGYYGERIVLKAQELGLNTCWVALTYKRVKTAFTVQRGEKLCIVIALGYGKTQGNPHKSRSIEELSEVEGEMPEWFKNGMEAAILAPTAINQQKFKLILDGKKVLAKAGNGICTKIDLGIVKYHFEIGAGKNSFEWI